MDIFSSARRAARVVTSGDIGFAVRKKLWELEDVAWDLRWGVRTRAMVGADELGLTGPNVEHASSPIVRGQPIVYATPRIGGLRYVLRSVPATGPRHLLDYGCGMGRVMMAAVLEGYESADGVELSAVACDQARRNLESFARRVGRRAERITVTEADATDHPIRPEHNVFYLYNPFGPPVLGAVLDRIAASVSEQPREAHVVYVNHVHKSVFDDHPALTFERSWSRQRYETSLYRVSSAG